jgi:large subunit ribosomal protein L21
MYAVVKTGGKQYKVAVDDVITVEKVVGKADTEISLVPLLLVDGSDVTTDAAALAAYAVTAKVVEHTKGPKIRIHKFKNKTGYHKRQGHRQPLTKIQVVGIAKSKSK